MATIIEFGTLPLEERDRGVKILAAMSDIVGEYYALNPVYREDFITDPKVHFSERTVAKARNTGWKAQFQAEKGIFQPSEIPSADSTVPKTPQL